MLTGKYTFLFPYTYIYIYIFPRETTAAKEEIRILAVKCMEAWEERQDSLEVLEN
jgi:hypothetical protein